MPNPFWVHADDVIIEEMFGFVANKFDKTYGAYGYVGSSRLDKDTHDAVMMAHYLAGETFRITQGGLNSGAVAASAQTHNGLGVMDTARDNVGMTMADAFRVVSFGMDCGVHGMIRGVPGYDHMVDHIHWVRIDAKAFQHPSTYQQIYNSRYGTAHGGGGLAGAPSVRWYGPTLKPLTSWAKSKYNPVNGWRP